MSAKYDGAIHDFLERRAPDQFDEFMRVVGCALGAMLPSIARRVRAYGNNFDAEEVVSRGIERALELLRAQYLGQATRFRFTRDYGLPFEAWVMTVIGRPGAGASSGIVGDEIRQSKRDSARRVDIDGYVDSLPAGDAPAHEEELWTKTVDLEALVQALEPRERFVLRAEFGYHGYGTLDAPTVVRMAAEAQLPPREVGKMRRRVRNLFLGPKQATRLSQAEIAQLLDVSERQVYNIKQKALRSLRPTA